MAADGDPWIVTSRSAGGLEANAAALVLSGQEGGDLEVEARLWRLGLDKGRLELDEGRLEGDEGEREGQSAAQGFEIPPGKTAAALVVDLSGPSLLAGLAPDYSGPLVIEIYVYVLDRRGGVAGFSAQGVRLTPDSTRREDLRQGGGVKVVAPLALSGGRRGDDALTLRLLVLQRQSDRFRLRSVDLEDSLDSLPPLFQPPQDWAVATPPSSPSWLFPWRRDAGSGIAPFVAPRLASDAPTLLWLPTAQGASPPRLIADPVEGGDRLEVDLEVAAGEAPRSPAGFDTSWTPWRLPATFWPEGEYRLRVRGRGTGDIGELQASVRLGISSLSAPPEGAGEPPAPTAEPVPVRPAEGSVYQLDPLMEAYANAVLGSPRRSAGPAAEPGRRPAPASVGASTSVGAPRPSAARWRAVQEEVARVERSYLGSGDARRLAALTKAELEVALWASRQDPEVLVPLMHLHESLFRRYHGAGELLLATHSRRHLERLMQVYRERGGDEGLQHLARLESSIAGYLLSLGSVSSAKLAYQRALQDDPQQPTALLGLAAIEEAYGNVGSAIGLLERLLKVQPEHAEGQLRRAVNLGRESPRRGARALGRCLDRGAEWMKILAHQELARLWVAMGRGDEAAELLASAVNRFGDNQRLHLQYAAVLDGLGRLSEASSALGELDSVSNRRETPRWRYARWPQEGTLEVRRSLIESAESRRPDLTQGLERWTSPAPPLATPPRPRRPPPRRGGRGP
ncbi:MAG: tetratricopeptide repeat protein [Acidobacteriota bacterium]